MPFQIWQNTLIYLTEDMSLVVITGCCAGGSDFAFIQGKEKSFIDGC
jgi:hypothetical protein